MAPVSGSKNTKIEGMMVRIATFKISLKSGLLRDAILLKYKIGFLIHSHFKLTYSKNDLPKIFIKSKSGYFSSNFFCAIFFNFKSKFLLKCTPSLLKL